MNFKKFEYHHKDIPMLKKDVIIRILFTVLFFALLIWQFVSLLINYTTASVTLPILVSAIIVIVMSALLAGLSLIYAFKSLKTLATIKQYGYCVSSVDILFSVKKSGFLNLYSIVTNIITLITTLVLITSVVYAFLEVAYFSAISFFMPVLMLLCLSGYNSSYQIKNEIDIQQFVDEFHKVF